MLSIIEKKKYTFLIQGLLLSILLLTFADILYKITFNHAISVDPNLYNVKIAFIDDKIPVLPIFFIGYNLGFIYWFFAPFYILKTGKKKTIVFIYTFVITLLVCNLILYFFPAKLDRVAEGLFDPNKNTFGWKLLRICYNMDGGLVGYNLLPSTHCANCVLYYQALKDGNIPKIIQNAALFSTVIVSLSTLFIKQHYFLDSLTGILIPIIIKIVIEKIKQRT